LTGKDRKEPPLPELEGSFVVLQEGKRMDFEKKENREGQIEICYRELR